MMEIAGREKDIERLRLALKNARGGRGGTILLSGELGIGKSALCDQVSEIALEMGFQTLKGWCFPGYLKPYLPIESALKPINLSHIFKISAPPKIESVFLIANSGILMRSVEREGLGIDADIFTGMLTAVGHFVRDSMGVMGEAGDSLDVLGYGGMRILIEKGDLCSMAVVISGRENEYLLEDMKSALERIHTDFGDILRRWDNDTEKIAGTEEILGSLIESGKYEGIDYSREDPKLRIGNVMENVTLGLVRNSTKNPLLLIIEDIQWADSATMALLHYLSRNIRNSRILVIGTYRPEEIISEDGEKNRVFETINMMRAEGLTEEIALKPLDVVCFPEFVEKKLGKIENVEEFARGIHTESGGNPLFACEILNMLVEEAMIGALDGYELTRKLESIRIPSRIQEIIMRKIERLCEEEREIADAASVLGQDFTPETISKMLGKRKIEVLKSMRRMEKRVNLIEKKGIEYRFKNPKIRDILYEELGEELSRAYHEIAAEALEEIYGERPDHSILGYHYYSAGIADRAIEHLMKAAEMAMHEYSNEEAVKQLSQVLELASEEGWKNERCMALKWMGEIHATMGEYGKAIEFLRESEKLAENSLSREIARKIAEAYQQTGDYDRSLQILHDAKEGVAPVERGRILLVEGNIFYRKGDYEKAMDIFEKSLEYLEKEGEVRDISTAIRAIGNIYYSRGDYESALRYYESALKAGKEDLLGKAMSLNNMGVVNVRLGNYWKAAEYFEEALKIREKIGDQWGIAMFLSNLGVVFSEKGDYGPAMDYFLRSLKIREKIGDQWGMAMSLNNIGLVHFERGEYPQSIEFFKKALEIREKIGDREGVASSLITMGMAHLEIGDDEKAMGLYEKALRIKEEIGDREGIAESLNGIGRSHLMKGDFENALKYIEHSRKISEETGSRRMLVYNLCSMAELYLERGEIEAAEKMCSEIGEAVPEMGSTEMEAWNLRIKGVLCYKKGRIEESVKNLRESVDKYRKMGRSGDMAKGIYWLALVIGGEEGKRLMEDSLHIFRKNNMKIWEKRVKEFMDGKGS